MIAMYRRGPHGHSALLFLWTIKHRRPRAARACVCRVEVGQRFWPGRLLHHVIAHSDRLGQAVRVWDDDTQVLANFPEFMRYCLVRVPHRCLLVLQHGAQLMIVGHTAQVHDVRLLGAEVDAHTLHGAEGRIGVEEKLTHGVHGFLLVKHDVSAGDNPYKAVDAVALLAVRTVWYFAGHHLCLTGDPSKPFME